MFIAFKLFVTSELNYLLFISPFINLLNINKNLAGYIIYLNRIFQFALIMKRHKHVSIYSNLILAMFYKKIT